MISNGALKDACSYIKTFLTQASLLESALAVEVEFAEDKVTFKGNNDYASFGICNKAEVTDSGSCFVDANLFVKVASRIPAGTIMVEKGANDLVLSTSTYSANITAVENPLTFNPPSEPAEMSNGKDILTAMNSILWAVDRKSAMLTMPLDCVYIAKAEDNVTDVVTSDRNVMPVISINGASIQFDKALIPFKAVQSIQKFYDSEEVFIGWADGMLKLQDCNKYMYCRTIQADYVDYAGLYGKAGEPAISLNLSGTDISQVLKRVGILFSGKYFVVNLAYDSGVLTVSSSGEGGNINESINVPNGEEGSFNVKVNNAYLTNAVDTAGEDVYLDYLGDKKPIIIKTGNGSYKCLVTLIVGD